MAGAAQGDAESRGTPGRPSLVALALLVALCAAIYAEVRALAPAASDNMRTFCALEHGLERYDLRQEWRPRIAATALAAAMVAPCTDDEYLEHDGVRYPFHGSAVDWSRLSHRIALWSALWFAATGAILMLAWRRRAPLLLAGLFVGVAFGYLPGSVSEVFPWDLPALFFATAAVTLLRAGRTEWLCLLLPLAVPFKESAVVFAIAFLFWEDATWRRRLAWGLLAGALCVAAKLAVDLTTSSPALMTMTIEDSAGPLASGPRIWDNLAVFASLRWPHPLLINGGTLVAFLVLPITGRQMLTLKVIAAVFCAATLLYGVVTEFRIWFEMIPVALLGFELAHRSRAPLRGAVGLHRRGQ